MIKHSIEPATEAGTNRPLVKVVSMHYDGDRHMYSTQRCMSVKEFDEWVKEQYDLHQAILQYRVATAPNCDNCHGRGTVISDYHVTKHCPSCNGRGKKI